MSNLLKKYESLGTPEEIKATFKASEELLKKVESIEKTLGKKLEEIPELVKSYEELGKPEEIKAVFKAKEELVKKVESIEKTLGKKLEEIPELVKSYEELGKPEELKKVLNNFEETIEELEGYIEFFEEYGYPEEIKEIIDRVYEAEIQAIANKYGVSIEKVQKLVNNFKNFDEVEEFLEELQGYTKKNESNARKIVVEVEKEEDFPEKKSKNKLESSKLLERYKKIAIRV